MVREELADGTSNADHAKDQGVYPSRAASETMTRADEDREQSRWYVHDEFYHRNPATCTEGHFGKTVIRWNDRD